jgi:hypothetical protein
MTILYKGKRIENREKWQGCSYRGPVLLHAAKSVGTIDEFDDVITTLMMNGVTREYVQTELARYGPRIGRRDCVWSPLAKLPRGGIMGRARIAGVISGNRYGERDFAAYAANTPEGEMQRKWWWGKFALVLEDVEPMPFVPWSGALGLFEVDEQKLPGEYRR